MIYIQIDGIRSAGQPQDLMYVCLCKAITDKQIRDAVDNGVQNIAQLQETCGAASGCGSCRDVAQDLIDERLADTRYYTA